MHGPRMMLLQEESSSAVAVYAKNTEKKLEQMDLMVDELVQLIQVMDALWFGWYEVHE